MFEAVRPKSPAVEMVNSIFFFWGGGGCVCVCVSFELWHFVIQSWLDSMLTVVELLGKTSFWNPQNLGAPLI